VKSACHGDGDKEDGSAYHGDGYIGGREGDDCEVKSAYGGDGDEEYGRAMTML
jgi:hypothetical protein